MSKISKQAYAEMFGPTVGDRVRLADTELLIEVEKDFTTYGDEVKFGGGKVIRDGMGQSQRLSAEVVDLVITNALILDYWGIVKADVGIKAGRIVGIGKAGKGALSHLHPQHLGSTVLRALAEKVDPVFLPRPLLMASALGRSESGKLTRSQVWGLIRKLKGDQPAPS